MSDMVLICLKTKKNNKILKENVDATKTLPYVRLNTIEEYQNLVF